MDKTFTITRRDFKIWRHFLAGYLMICLGCFWFFFLPFGVPAWCYVELMGKDTGIIARELSELPGYSFSVLLVAFPIPLFIMAVCEKAKLPITIKFVECVVLEDKKGKTWKIPYSKCRCSTAFAHYCALTGFFMGTWVRGITIYIPREYLKGFSGNTGHANDNGPADEAFHIPVSSENQSEVVSFLERKRCKLLPRPTLSRLLAFVFAPMLFVWSHFAVALPLMNQIGNYGVIGAMIVGIISGTIVAVSAVAKPYRKIEHVRRKLSVMFGLYGLISPAIIVPIYLWCHPLETPELLPNVFGAVFVFFFFYGESYLWRYCLLKKER